LFAISRKKTIKIAIFDLMTIFIVFQWPHFNQRVF
jgi:hypothetical protein